MLKGIKAVIQLKKEKKQLVATRKQAVNELEKLTKQLQKL